METQDPQAGHETEHQDGITLKISRRTLMGVIGTLGIIIAIGAGCLFQDIGRDSVHVSSFSPAGEVQPGTNLTVTFSKDLVADSVLNKMRDGNFISFEPPLTGKYQWIDNDELRFYPDVTLAPSTSYTADINPAVARAAGLALKGETEYSFHTPILRVTSANLNFEFVQDNSTIADLVSSIEFNYPVDPGRADEFISLSYRSGGEIAYEMLTTTISNVIELRAAGVQRGEDEQQIELMVSPGLVPEGGRQGLAQAFIEPVLIPGQEDLKVYRVRPVREAPDQGSIRVQFNIPVRLEDVEQYIVIQPDVDYRATSSHSYLNLRGAFDPDQTYKVSLSEGLRAIDGSSLPQRYATSVTFLKEDIDPQVDFVGTGYFLTRSGNLNLGLSTINMSEVEVEIERVFANNLVHLLNTTTLTQQDEYYDYEAGQYYYYNSYLNMPALGQSLHTYDVGVESIQNDEVITPLNVESYLSPDQVGIYRITARESERRWRNASRWVVATDLGLYAKRSGPDLWVWVHSLGSLEPVAGVELALYSQNNQELMTTLTNAEGLGVFRAVDQSAEGFAPYLVTATRGQDLSFLELTRRRIPTSDFEVEGDPYLEAGYDAFLFDERGIYRPGEIVNLAAVVREAAAGVPTAFPVRLQITGPDGRIMTEQRSSLNDQGAAAFAVDIPDFAQTGRYTSRLLIGTDEEIGRSAFSVEEFIPDRMKVSLSTDRDTYRAGDPIEIEVEGMTLFGPPAAGRRVDANIEVEAFPFSAENWSGFSFGDYTLNFSQQRYDLESAQLNDVGHHTFRFVIPRNVRPPSALRGVISATVLEPGGRGVTAYQGVIIHPQASYVGLKKSQEGYAQPGRPVSIDYVVVSSEGEALSGRQLDVTFEHIYWHSILKRVDGKYRYVSERVEEEVNQTRITSSNGAAQFEVTPEEYGSYRVRVRDVSTGATSVLSFYASGWGYAPWAMDTPDRVEIDLDRPQYEVGQQARVQIRAPFSGKLLLTVERDQVLHHQVVEMTENTATIELPIENTFKPNAYVSALLFRSTDELERDTPARAFGVVPLMVDNRSNQLTVEFDVPEAMRPNQPLTIEFEVEGNSQGRPMVAVAAVDEGILQLNDFQTPDIFGHFFGKKRLGVDSYDMYGMILPEIAPTLTSVAGDVETSRKRRLSPQTARRVRPVAFWSGLLETNSSGRGEVTFDLPEFNGTIRLMAVAFSGNTFGSSEQELLVRDPVVLTPTFPRFMSSGDRLSIPVAVFNGTDSDATFDVNLSAQGPVQIQGGENQSINITQGAEELVYFDILADEATGNVDFRVEVNGNGEQSGFSVEVPIRPPVPFTTVSGNGTFTSDDDVTFTLPADFIPGTVTYEVAVSSFPAIQFSGSLQYLLQYPHGCLEQTTSRVFPLLAFDALSQVVEPELFAQNSSDYYIEEGITKLEQMQQPSGSFSYWPGGGYSNNWSSIYAAHFLVEARRAGYQVSDRVYDRLMDALRTFTRSYRGTESYGYQTVAYAAYVLALAGEPDKSTMNFLKNSVIDRLNVYSQFQLAGAYGLSGDRQTALSLLPQTISVNVDRESGGNFNSNTRAQAIMLDILSELDPNNANVPNLVRNLTDALSQDRRFYTTQSNSFAFLALGKILRRQGQGNYTGSVSVGGQSIAQIDNDSNRFTGDDWAGRDVRMSITGTGTAYYFWRADGIPSGMNVDEFDNDLVVRRRYLRENGSPYTDYSQFRQGDLIVAEITLSAPGEEIQNVAVVDMLPSGFEIENPRLQSRQAVDWMQNTYSPDYMDIRDDRMIIYGSVQRGTPRKFYYGLRAVSVGEFILPPIRAEAMYDPLKASVASSGRVTVNRLNVQPLSAVDNP